MQLRETDSYGEWVIRKVQQEAGGEVNPLPAEVLTAARVVWPRIPSLVASEIKREGSVRKAETLAADIWEGVLRSVGRAARRNGNYASSIRDPESYLLVAFQQRFRRFQKTENRRRHQVSVRLSKPRSGLGRGRTRQRIVGLLKAGKVKESAYAAG